MTPYVSLRKLADLIAQHGMPTLRFDYPGTGDSSDPAFAEEEGHWLLWQRSIDAAMNWLRSATGARRVVLCGVRLGGALAVLAATRRDDVAGLILIEPVLEGRSYVRQISLESELLYGKSRAPNEDLLLHELRLSPSTLESISAVSLRRIALPAGLKLALFTRTKSRHLAECAEAWLECGVELSQPSSKGLEAMFNGKVIEEAPLADFGSVLQWLDEAFPGAPTNLPQRAVVGAFLRLANVTETPVVFGPDGRLFGILCEPASGRRQCVVIIGNCGHDPHYGPARQATTLARRLASAGIACLRFDFSGLGDSIGPPGRQDVRSHVFGVDRLPDLKAAIDEMEELGFQQFGLQGICSGAYHAFHAALAEPRISMLMMVNIPLFTLPTLDVLAHVEQRYHGPFYFAGRIFHRNSWKLVLKGERNLGMAIRIQFLHAPIRILRRLHILARRIGLVRARSFAWEAMERLSQRDVRTLFVLSPEDAENEVITHAFGPAGEALHEFPNTQVNVVPQMDHGLMKARERGLAEDLMVNFARVAIWGALGS